jgi:Arc/MetJ-type ribon-helix-helix transcriptional regulator
MKLVTVLLPATLLNDAEDLVRLGVFNSRSDVIRSGLRDIIQKNQWRLEKKAK